MNCERKNFLFRLKIIFVTAALVSIFFLSCEEDKTVSLSGRISYVNLEGGFYGIYGDDGNKYDPINLAAEFQKDSLRVMFEGKILTGQASVRQWGKVFQISRMDRIQ